MSTATNLACNAGSPPLRRRYAYSDVQARGKLMSTDMQAVLEAARHAILDLSEQQAMPDDSYLVALEQINDALAALEGDRKPFGYYTHSQTNRRPGRFQRCKPPEQIDPFVVTPLYADLDEGETTKVCNEIRKVLGLSSNVPFSELPACVEASKVALAYWYNEALHWEPGRSLREIRSHDNP